MNKLGSIRSVIDGILACFEGCTEDDAPLAGCFDAGSSSSSSSPSSRLAIWRCNAAFLLSHELDLFPGE